jgi:hypothetical protein
VEIAEVVVARAGLDALIAQHARDPAAKRRTVPPQRLDEVALQRLQRLHLGVVEAVLEHHHVRPQRRILVLERDHLVLGGIAGDGQVEHLDAPSLAQGRMRERVLEQRRPRLGLRDAVAEGDRVAERGDAQQAGRVRGERLVPALPQRVGLYTHPARVGVEAGLELVGEPRDRRGAVDQAAPLARPLAQLAGGQVVHVAEQAQEQLRTRERERQHGEREQCLVTHRAGWGHAGILRMERAPSASATRADS